MTDKEEKLARDALKCLMIFMLAISAPIWAPVLFLGAFVCAPIWLLYVLINDEKEAKENEERNHIE